MAVSANANWEVRTTGNDANGGGFVSGASGNDYSLQDAPQATLTTAATVHTTTTQINVPSGQYTVAATDIGNIYQVGGGTATLGFYQITAADTVNNRWTVDRAVGTSAQTCSGRMGGGLLTLGKVGAIGANQLVAGQRVWIKAGTYSITSATTNIAAGCFAPAVALYIEGYQTTHGDLGTRPLLQASAIATFTIIAAATDSYIGNIAVDGIAAVSSRAFSIAARQFLYKVKALNCTNSGFNMAQTCSLVLCEATGCSTQPAFNVAIGTAALFGCEAYINTVTGFSNSSAADVAFSDCLSYDNSGATSDGFISAVAGSSFFNCVAYNNGRDGFRTSVASTQYVNCISEANAAFGFDNSGSAALVQLYNCATFNNTSGATTGTLFRNLNPVVGSGSFFVNAAGGNFALNATSSAGASCRAAGILGTFGSGNSTGYQDIGAVQHQDPAATGSTGFSVGNLLVRT